MRQADNNEKLVKAGFQIVRSDDNPSPRIKLWKKDSSWVTISKYTTKAARDRDLEKMLEDDHVITG